MTSTARQRTLASTFRTVATVHQHTQTGDTKTTPGEPAQVADIYELRKRGAASGVGEG
jgi:hypothetical protein